MLETIDIVFRTVAVVAAVLLAVLILTTGRQRPAAVPGALFCLAVAAFFVTSGSGVGATLGIWRYPLAALCITKAVWFWLFARALFIDDARLDRRHIAIAGAIALAGTWQQIAFLTQYRANAATVWEAVAGLGFEGVLLLFVLLGLYAAWRDLAVDLIGRRRRLRLGFMVVTGVYLTATLAVQTYNLLLDVSTPAFAARANMIVVAVSFFAAAWFLLRPRSASWLDTARTTTSVALNQVESAVLANLKRALETDRVHLHEGLSIGALAERLGTGEHVLRRVINHGMGYRNFNDFLHAWRIREACEELSRPEQARVPVLSIAMKVGYGSIGAFNRAFKARIGMTPTDYRRNMINGASHAR
ncbi:MAG: helix-turn-helix domain-containing protein [Woeseiaceae bacterium]